MANQEEELISKFKDVTGTSDDGRARFFLESSDWVLQTAICSFYENQPESELNSSSDAILEDQDNPSIVEVSEDTEEDTRNNLNLASVLTGGVNLSGFDTNMSNPNNSQKKSTNKPRIATLHNMSQHSPSDEEGQAFYAGGSERSGQQVLGPPKRKNFREQLTEMFRMAHESGAVVDPSTASSSSSRSRNRDLYQGAGLRLGQTEDDHTLVTEGAERSTRSQNVEPVILKLWSQGFSINDGELRPYDDPQNKEFLETVMRGQIPNELRQMGSMVSVDLEDHRHEDYKKPATKSKTFKGSGHTLGRPAPKVEETTIQPEVPASVSTSSATPTSDKEENEKKAIEQLKLQNDQPTTMLQIRLADGSRISGRFNITHTVDDIRQYIITSRPEYEFSNFILVTAFPTKELSDGSQSIQDAGLLNASIMQRIKQN